MNRAAISTNERHFIHKALEEELRIDGRRPYDYRKLQFQISPDGTSVTLMLGQTLVVTSVSATLEPPAPERPNEGVLRLNVDFSSMASPGLDASSSRAPDEAPDVQRLLEKGIRDVSVVDLEGLCVLPGRKVWRIQLDIRILDAAGNATDAAFLSALAALMACRRPEVSVGGGDDGSQGALVVHSTEEREALALSLHQAPMAVTFALFGDGDSVLVDPSVKEEAACAGSLTVVLNAHSELCLLHKAGGLGLSLPQVMRLVKVAGVKMAELSEKLKAALAVHESARVALRVRRKEPQKMQAGASRSVTVLSSADISGGSPRAELSNEDLDALERAAAEVSSSEEDEEEINEGGKDADANGATRMDDDEFDDSSGLEGQPVGVGVFAPPKDSEEPSEQDGDLMDEDEAPSTSTAPIRTQEPEHQKRQKLGQGEAAEPLDEYERIAAVIAGSAKQSGGLQAAVKRKQTKGKERSSDLAKALSKEAHSCAESIEEPKEVSSKTTKPAEG